MTTSNKKEGWPYESELESCLRLALQNSRADYATLLQRWKEVQEENRHYFEDQLADDKEIERLTTELENEQARGIHTCHSKCQRPMCVKNRENAALRLALESIAKNTCCDKCQEAALVARKALAP